MTGGYVKTKNEKKYFPSMKKFLTCTPRYHVVTAVIAPFLEALDLGFASVSSLQKRCYNLHLQKCSICCVAIKTVQQFSHDGLKRRIPIVNNNVINAFTIDNNSNNHFLIPYYDVTGQKLERLVIWVSFGRLTEFRKHRKTAWLVAKNLANFWPFHFR